MINLNCRELGISIFNIIFSAILGFGFAFISFQLILFRVFYIPFTLVETTYPIISIGLLVLILIILYCLWRVQRRTKWPKKIYSNEGISLPCTILILATINILIYTIGDLLNAANVFIFTACLTYGVSKIFLNSKLIERVFLLCMGGYALIEASHLFGWIGNESSDSLLEIVCLLFGLISIGLSVIIEPYLKISLGRVSLVTSLIINSFFTSFILGLLRAAG